MQALAIEPPEAQQLGQVVADVAGARKPLVAHQQPGGIHQLGIAGLGAGQQTIHQIPIQGVERMGLVGGTGLTWAFTGFARWRPGGFRHRTGELGC